MGPRAFVLRRALATAFCAPAALLAFVGVALTLLLLAIVWRPALHRAARAGCRLIVALAGVRLRVVGEFPREGTYIVMANHTSFVDLFVLPTFLRGRFTGVMAEEMMRYPLLEAVLKKMRIVPIVRQDQDQALASLKVAEEALHAGYHVVILPEGTRSLDGRLRPFKSGGFYMAVAARAPILPVGITGAFEYKPKKRWTIDPGPVTVNIGRPVSPQEYDALGTSGLKDRVRAEIASLIGERAGA